MVIAKAPKGSKYEAAVGWNTTLVSLPWLYACEKERGEFDKGRRPVYGVWVLHICAGWYPSLPSHLSPTTDPHALLILSYHPFPSLCPQCTWSPANSPSSPPPTPRPRSGMNTCMSICT